MIAWAGAERLALGLVDDFDFAARAGQLEREAVGDAMVDLSQEQLGPVARPREVRRAAIQVGRRHGVAHRLGFLAQGPAHLVLVAGLGLGHGVAPGVKGIRRRAG